MARFMLRTAQPNSPAKISALTTDVKLDTEYRPRQLTCSTAMHRRSDINVGQCLIRAANHPTMKTGLDPDGPRSTVDDGEYGVPYR